jgi:hypothetical protein
MRVLGWLAVVIVLGTLANLISPNKAAHDSSEQSSPAQEVRPTAAEQKVLTALKAEPKVKDVLFQPGQAVEWTVGVLPDGTPDRVGYGMYLCEVLKEAGAVRPRTLVRVADIVKITREQVPPREASLGTVDCNTYERSSLP